MSEIPASVQEGVINPETGIAPERRFQNPKDKADGEWLHTQLGLFKMVGCTTEEERRQVESMLRFAPPFSASELKALNWENMPNSTMGELPRRIADDEGNWTDYVVSASGLWEITFPDLPGEIADSCKEQISALLNTLWMDDPRHVLALQLAFRQFSCYGIGPLVWTDCYDPTPVARIASDLKFNPGTRLTLDNFSECSLKDTFLAQELYGTLRGEIGKNREKLHGWNRTEVMKVLKKNARNDGSSSPWGGTMEEVELRERSGENIWSDYKRHEIPVFHMFVREYEPDVKGKMISHMVLAHDGAKWRIIRDRGFEYSSPWQFLVLATDRVGSDMTISGLRGSGVDMLDTCWSMDVMHCASMSAGIRSSLPVYLSKGGNGAQTADQISVRPNGVIIPSGFEEVQSHVDFQAGGWQNDRLSNLLDRQQRVYDINAPNKGGVQRTKGEAVLDAAKESDSRSNQILPIIRLFFEPLGREFARRLFYFPKTTDGSMMKFKGWEIATVFWDRLGKIIGEWGMDSKLLLSHRITINPNNTPGGLDKKMLKFEAAMRMLYPTLQEQKQRNFLTNGLGTSLFGHQAWRPYVNKDEPEIPGPLEEQIDSENAMMAAGQQRRVFPWQDHLRHLGPLAPEGTGHVPFIMSKLAEIQQGVFDKFSMDELDSLSHQLRAAVTLKGHGDAHLALLSQNPVLMDMPEIQGYFDFFAQLEQILIQSINHFEKQMAERSADGQGDPKTAALLAKTKAEIQTMQMRTQADIAMMNQKHMVKLGNQTQTAEARRDQKNAAFILDEIVKKKKAEADIAISGMSNILDLQKERQKLDMQKKAAEDSTTKSP